MSTRQKILFVILAVACVVLVGLAAPANKNPCGVAEFGPDVPVHIKEQCREHRRVKT